MIVVVIIVHLVIRGRIGGRARLSVRSGGGLWKPGSGAEVRTGDRVRIRAKLRAGVRVGVAALG